MKNYYKATTKKTPEIYFKTDGKFAISGSTYMENPNAFYDPLFLWLTEFLKANNKKILLEISLGYVNSSSSKQILNLITLLSNSGATKVKVIWFYEFEDSDLLELGENLQQLTKNEFQFKTYKN